MNDLVIIKNKIIEKAFPELKLQKIIVQYQKLDDSYAETGNHWGNYYTYVNNSLKTVPIAVLDGCLAHEISHILMDFKRIITSKIFYEWAYSLSSKYRIFDERRVDLLAIKRGYGQALLEFSKWCDKKERNEDGDFDRESGLTTSELEKLV